MTDPEEGTHRPPPAGHGGRGGRRRLLAAAAAALALIGVGLIVRAAHGQQTAPQPVHSQATGSHTTSRTPDRTTRSPGGQSPSPSQVYLPASRPLTITIPAIGVHARVMRLGLHHDGTIEVPPLNEKTSHAGWYQNSPAPGQLGPAIILGHVDSAASGPAVFFKLGALHPGDHIDITRADHIDARFTIDKVARYPKNHFPTDAVYGSTTHASLRLITCGGTFDPAKHSYRDNTVVYATLTSRHRR